jgi:chromosomal replication initiation ATPase DnaA
MPKPPADDAVTIGHVIKAAADYFGVRVTDLLMRRRNPKVVWRRHVAIYLACHMTTRSLTVIGRTFGDIDHTTVLHARRRIEAMKDHPDVLAIKGMIEDDIRRAREAQLADPNQLAMEI